MYIPIIHTGEPRHDTIAENMYIQTNNLLQMKYREHDY